MINSLLITPSPKRDRGNVLETRPGIKPSGRGDVIPNLPALGNPHTSGRGGGQIELYEPYKHKMLLWAVSWLMSKS
jgi:hypothetical protein